MPTLPHTYANEIVFSHTAVVAAVPELAVADTGSSSSNTHSTSLFLLSALGICYFFGPSIFRWRFPCRTPEALLTQIENLDAVIDANSFTDDRLEDAADTFKASLHQLDKRVRELQVRPQPPRTNPLAWMLFRWRLLRDVDACYESFRGLEQRIKEAIYIAHAAG
ncbi:hypothetical protein VNI00_013607 [Paramarasmius palmivorus]|uniref:Uncharacterized protein n=1 Tax=Paramarasmius palmivorus TaxID=297713 RepID=A0AAW0BXW1_9AGAR